VPILGDFRPFQAFVQPNYGGRIQPALGTEFVYPIYYFLVWTFWNRMYPFYNMLSPFKWLQQIPGSKYRILGKLTQIMGVASSPLWGPRSCILSTTVFWCSVWNRMYPFYNILSPFKWLQRIPGSKYQILNKLTQIMGVASSPLWGPSSCILSTTVKVVWCWNRMYQFYNMLSSSKWIHSILSKIQSGPSVFYILDQFEWYFSNFKCIISIYGGISINSGQF